MSVGEISLVARAVRTALDCGVGTVVVSSDDPEILAEGRKAGAKAVLRPSSLAGDDVATIDVVRHLVEQDARFDTVVLLQPTSPLRQPKDVVACLTALRHAESAATVCALDHPPEWNMTVDSDGTISPVDGWPIPTRRQEATPIYRLNGAVYAATSDWIHRGRGLVDKGTVAVVMPTDRSVDVDDLLGLHLARAAFALQSAGGA